MAAKVFFAFLALVAIESAYSATSISFRWCVTQKELSKCKEFLKYANITAQNKSLVMGTLSCVQGNSSDDCATKIKANEADVVTLDGGRVYTAGKEKGLVPIVSEEYGKYGVKYYAVAIVKKSNTGFDLTTLQDKKSCHTGARRTAGWNVPVGYLLRTKIIPWKECNSSFHDFYSAAAFFNESCVSGMSKYNVSKKVHDTLCALCVGTGADKCSSDYSKNKYSGYHGAFMCMAEGKGDVAFAKHTTVEEVVSKGKHGSKTDYEYLCKDGTRKDVGQHEKCHLGFNPAHAVVTRKDNKDIDNIVTILTAMSSMYGSSQTDVNKFQLFNSSQYGYGNNSNLLFKDSSTALVSIPEDKRTYEGYLGKEYVQDAEALKNCNFYTSTTSTTKGPKPTSASTKTAANALMLLAAALLTVLWL